MSMKSYAIFLNGEYPPEENKFYLKLVQGVDCAVAVDGAQALFERFDLTPDIIVADFDSSAPPPAEFDGETITLDPDKDQTDGELALELALGRGAEDIVLCGYRGGPASDQILGNLLLLQKAADSERVVSACCLSAFESVRFVRDRVLELQGEPGEIISVVALDNQIRLSATGVRYAVSDLKIKRGATRGLSNTLIGSVCRLTISGAALVFQRRNASTTL